MFKNPYDAVIYYDLVCYEQIQGDSEINDFSSKLNSTISNLKISTKSVDVYNHPLLTVKNGIKRLRLVIVRNRFNKLVDSNLLNYVSKAKSFDEAVEYASSRKYGLVKKYVKDNKSKL